VAGGGYGSAMMRAQGALLEALVDGADDPAGRRKALTEGLSEIVTALACALRPELVLEIGANEATFSRRVKAELPESRVIAFEANPTFFPARSAVPLAAGVEYRQLCVGERPGLREFKVPVFNSRPNRSMGSMLADLKSSEFLCYEVEAVTLDGYLADSRGLHNVMWVDVEGAAGQVIEGAAATLRHCSLLYAELETTPRWAGQHTDGAIIDMLAGFGLAPLLRDVQRAGWQYNCLFIRAGLAATPAVELALQSFAGLT